MFEYLNGFRKAMYWSKGKMVAHAKKYSPGYKKDLEKGTQWTFWAKDFDGMAYKTMLRQLISKWGPTSTEMQTAEKYDDKGSTPVQEMQEKANRTMVDVQVDESTGEVMNPEALPAQDVKPEKEPAPPEAFDPGF